VMRWASGKNRRAREAGSSCAQADCRPSASHPLPENPPAAEVYGERGLLGYPFLTDQVTPIPGYSGKPIRVLVALDARGRIRGIRLLHHEEPILAAGVSEKALKHFVEQYQGLDIQKRFRIGGRERPGYVILDGLSGATITAMVINASIERSAKRIAASRGLLGKPPERNHTPLWKQTWRERSATIAILVAGLGVLTLILIFQDPLAQRPRVLKLLRYAFLAFTLLFIGVYAMGQLSVINILTFLHAATHDFRWEAFLIDPVLFILWAFVAVVLLLWGRGVYCGWLCPFGAIQEFVQHLGRWLRLPQLEFPDIVHERLWALKYVIFLILFGLSLQSLKDAIPYAEVEPFKTVFALHFQREWPFVAYALAMILVSAVNRKFFCKYLCPLGGALAIPARMKLFDWLRRRKECGRPCQICANECEVRAIRATGEINPLECQYCLDCQITYWDPYKCPPLVERRKRRERARRVPGM
ncbi:MAG: 4Fe-4S binding protein, partial [Gammaproteobacteria bacterium]